jgi:hypothetical protein
MARDTNRPTNRTRRSPTRPASPPASTNAPGARRLAPSTAARDDFATLRTGQVPNVGSPRASLSRPTKGANDWRLLPTRELGPTDAMLEEAAEADPRVLGVEASRDEFGLEPQRVVECHLPGGVEGVLGHA